MKYKKLKDLEKTVKKDYAKIIIFGEKELPNIGHLFQVVEIPANTRQRVHYHHKQTELYYILEGTCSIFINSEEFLAEPGDSFLCSPRDKHNLWNKTENVFKLAVFKFNKPDDEDTVWEED